MLNRRCVGNLKRVPATGRSYASWLHGLPRRKFAGNINAVGDSHEAVRAVESRSSNSRSRFAANEMKRIKSPSELCNLGRQAFRLLHHERACNKRRERWDVGLAYAPTNEFRGANSQAI